MKFLYVSKAAISYRSGLKNYFLKWRFDPVVLGDSGVYKGFIKRGTLREKIIFGYHQEKNCTS